MAGHSKWANIRYKKAAVDARRGKVWTKIIREIAVAAKVGGGEIADNPRLRLATDKAMAANMPKDTIMRAIRRGAGGDETQNVEELTYEGYGPSGVAILIDVMTDNRNRIVAELRHAFTKHGGNFSTEGSVAYLFSKQGVITFAPGADADAILEVALESGADDVAVQDDGSVQVTTAPEAFQCVREALEAAEFAPDDAEITMLPTTYSELDEEVSEKVMKLVERLEDIDDVQSVFTNASYDSAVYSVSG